MASLIGGIENLIVENREVQRKTQTNRVSGRQLALCDIGSSLVRLEGLIGRVLTAVANGELGQVAVVITLPIRYLV